MLRLARLLGLVLVAVGLAAGVAAAHPLGNFSVNHYAGLEIGSTAVDIRYVIDMAEIPTFQELQDTGLVPTVGDPSVAPWLTRTVDALRRGLRLELDGRRLELSVVSSEVIFPPGAGDLPTLKAGVVYRAAFPGPLEGTHALRYADENFAGRAGWKEIVVRAGDVVLVSSTASSTDRSAALSDYPVDLLNSPPQDLEARVQFTVGASVAAPAGPAPTPTAPSTPSLTLRPNVQAPRSSGLASLVAGPQAGVGLLAVALLSAAVLGAFHALEPGHGKTVVAAYLVGSRGTAAHAVLLGLVVTASHTAGVYLLGGVTFYASQHVVPERLYPWLSALSGMTIAVLGLVLFLRRWRERGTGHHHHRHHHDHDHDHAHDHDHPHHHHDHGGHGHTHVPPGGSISLRALVALGVSGGIVPCPAALVVLLTAVSMHRIGFGLVLIVAFSVGLAAVLVAIGILMVYARRLMARFREDGPLIQRWLPLTSSAVMTVLGLGIAVQAVAPWLPR